MSSIQTALRSSIRHCSAAPPQRSIARWLHTTGSFHHASRNNLTFARPVPFSQRLEKLVARPFRRSYTNSNRSSPDASYRSAKSAVWSLILANAGVFLAWNYARASRDIKLTRFLHENALLNEANLAAGRYYTIVTSTFSHKDLGHFAFNMFALWTFGGMVALVPGVGAAHIYGLAFSSAVASSTAWLLHTRSKTPRIIEKKLGPFTTQRTKVMDSALGASGVVMATAAVATCLMPMTPMLIMAIVPAPLFVSTGLFVGIDLYLLEASDKIGHSAHLGGFVFGIAYYLAMLRKRGGIWQMMRRR